MRILCSCLIYLIIELPLLFANTSSLKYSNNIILNDIQNELSYFRINLDGKYTKITQTNNNSVLTVRVSSRRNNYEEVIMISLGSIGRYLNRLRSQTTNNKIPFLLPSIVTIDCITPVGRDNTILSCSVNNIILIQFSRNEITSIDLWKTIKPSIQSSMNFTIPDRTPEIFMADIDFENMISTRIALEGKNNPRLSKVISTALKARWVPGLESQLEDMLVSHLKSNHAHLMNKVMKKELNDEQMLRIGRQFFIHIQKPYEEIKHSHTSDSLKYVWKGNTYPIELDQYYTEYRKKHGL